MEIVTKVLVWDLAKASSKFHMFLASRKLMLIQSISVNASWVLSQDFIVFVKKRLNKTEWKKKQRLPFAFEYTIKKTHL